MQRFLLDEERHRKVDIALIGGSTTRKTLWTEDFLASEIGRHQGGAVRILDLTSNAQRLLDSWTLAELAACNGADVVILGSNVNRFMQEDPFDGKDPFFLVGSLGPEVASFVRGGFNPQYMTLRHRVFDRPAFVAQTLSSLSRALLEPSPGSNARGMGKTPVSSSFRHGYLLKSTDENFKHKAKLIAQAERKLAKAGGQGFDYLVFERIVKTVERCGARLITLVPPTNPDVLDPARSPVYSAAYAAHDRYLRATLGGVSSILVLNELAVYRSEDFLDWGHLATRESIRFSTLAMAEAIAPILREYGL
jgi:hypothetical protein